MEKRFPHLTNSNNFPGVDNVDPFRIQNRFDYTRWDVGTTLKVLNVNWCGDFENVVKFEDDAARDAWFDNAPGDSVQLDTPIRVLPGQSIKLPLPVDELYKYNYLMVDLSTATSDDRPIAFETNEHLSRFYYFIDDCSYIAPNTTEARVTLDVWTTFINRIQINYMMLERGHAPMAASGVDEYLKNPIANNKYLLASDFSTGEPAVTTAGEFVPFGSGEKFVMIATTFPTSELSKLNEASGPAPAVSGEWSYSDLESHRWGDGVVASLPGDAYAGGGYVYKTDELPNDTIYKKAQDDIPNNVAMLAVKAVDVYGGQVFEIMRDKAPQFFEQIQAVFVVDESMIELGAAHPLFGSTFYEVRAANKQLANLKLERADFGYPVEYENITKLYTYPYAALEVSDSSGAASVIKIEDTGVLNVYQKVSLAYPFIKFEAFLDGVGGNASDEYRWRTLTSGSVSEMIALNRDIDFTWDFEFPTFALYQNASASYKLHNYNANNVISYLNDKQNYLSTIASANNSYDNANDSAVTSNENAHSNATTAQANANASADTTNSNAIANAKTANANSIASATTANDNTLASAATTLANTKASNATANDNANRSNETANTNALASAATGNDNSIRTADVSYNNAVANTRTSYNNALRSTKNSKAATANTVKTNTRINAMQQQMNIYTTGRANAANAINTRKRNSLNKAIFAWQAGYNEALCDIQQAQAAVSMAGNVLSDIASTVGAAALPAVSGTGTQKPINMPGMVANAVNAGVQTIATVAAGEFSKNEGLKLQNGQTNETGYNAYDVFSVQNAQTVESMVFANTYTAGALKFENQLATTNTQNDVNTSNKNSLETYTTGLNTALETRTNSKAVANATRDTAVENANRSLQASNENASASRATADGNADASNVTTVANAKRTFDTGKANAARSLETATATANASETTANANAERSYNTSIKTADATLRTTVNNAQETLQRTKAVAQSAMDANVLKNAAGYLDKQVAPAIKIGSYSGDATPDAFHWRGLTFRVKTQKIGDLAQAGDMFLRYGYALNQQWAPETLTPMPHFSYWKCSDLWLVGGAGVIESAQRLIKEIFNRGVTIWKNPDEIGAIGIYGNSE